MSSLKLFLLGPPRLERDGVPLEFDTRKNIALIAYLMVTGETHTREALITLLWPKLEPRRARASLRRDLSTLRETLGEEWLVVDRETIGTDPGTDFWLDVEQFRRLLEAWRGHNHPEAEVCPECLTLLAEAIGLYRGDFLEGFTLPDAASFDDWQFFQTESLRGELAWALERLVRGHTAQGAYESALPYARRWLALDPSHEPAHRYLMQLYAASDQRAAALRQYEECVRILEAELDLAPSEETVSLYRQIRTGPVDRGEPPPPAPRPRHNLPAQTTPFIGREAQLAEVRWQLTCSEPEDEVRLLTLSGTAGTGKTRLALQVAADLLDDFDDGVFFVALTPIRHPALVIPTIARTLGLREVEGQPFGSTRGRPLLEVLKDHLRDKELLLVLDSFDRVTEASNSWRGSKRSSCSSSGYRR
jgi:DNA-binding SARP family transcriptional activator